MIWVYFDTGTTNSRAYLLDDGQVVTSCARPAGIRDSTMKGGRDGFVSAAFGIYTTLLANAGIDDAEVDSILMSGMASSPGGILEVPHLVTPVSRQELSRQFAGFHEDNYFHRDILLVPGVKSAPTPHKATLPGLGEQMMRGEETEALGLVDYLGPHGNYLVIFPGSHTQIVHLREGIIVDLFSAITGELWDALSHNTILRSSLAPAHLETLDAPYAQAGADTLTRFGFNRATYAVRTLQLFGDTTPDQRMSYMQGILTQGVLTGALQYFADQMHDLDGWIITGPRYEYDAFALLLSHQDQQTSIQHVQMDAPPLSVRGAISLTQHLDKPHTKPPQDRGGCASARSGDSVVFH